MKHKNSKFQVESLLFGQSGLLFSAINDEYSISLKRIFISCKEIRSHSPSANSVIRKTINFQQSEYFITDILTRISSLLSEILGNANSVAILEKISTEVSPFWHNHYQFGKPLEKQHPNSIGKQGIDNLIINAVVPFIYLYGKFHDNQTHWEKGLRILKQMEPENNIIIRNWGKLNIKVENASESQALIELYKTYCTKDIFPAA